MLNEIEALFAELDINKAYIITGKKAWRATRSYMPNCITDKADANFTFIEGYCTVQTVAEISSDLSSNSMDAVIGIGGGTVLDIAKASAIQAGVKSVLIPTIASTCAAWTPLSVFYDEKGTFTHYTEFQMANTLVLVEPAIIAKAPLQYLKAGIGDTLAKYYEADALIAALYEGEELPVWLQVSQFSAKICKDVLLGNGEDAIEAVSTGRVSPELISVIEAIIMTGGMVGGFGGKAGRVSGAHSVHNGLTEAKEVKDILHGELVAYGILVQLALEEKEEEILKLMTYYRTWGLPISLDALGIDIEDNSLLKRIVEKITFPTESIHLMKQNITEEAVLSAMNQVEQLNRQLL